MATYNLLPNIVGTFWDLNGNPLSNGKVYFYTSGTTDPAVVYQDNTGTPWPAEVELNARGQANIWLDDSVVYKARVYSSEDVFQYEQDPVVAAPSGSGGTGTGGGTNWINIIDYGADPTGVLDSTVAIQAAIDAANLVSAGILVPSGRYICTSTITQPTTGGPTYTFYGIRGDGFEASIFDFSGLTSGDAFNINNPPQSSVYQDFKVEGPGRTAPFVSTGMNFVSDGLGEYQGITECAFKRIKVTGFPTDGFRWEVPYVDIMEELIAVTIGRRGFMIDTAYSPWVAGTSTNFSSCWALECYETGFWFEPHVYSALNSCAADHCPVGYRFNGCTGMIINGCGYETGTDTPGTSGVGVWLDEPSGIAGGSFACNITGLWCYNFNPLITTFNSIVVNKGSYNNFDNCYVLIEAGGTASPYDVILTVDAGNNIFTNCINTSELDSKMRFNDLGYLNKVVYGGESGALTIETPDINGNIITGSGGGVYLSGDLYQAAIGLYVTGSPDFPALSFDNSAYISMGDGVGATDTFIQRSGVNELTMSPLAELTVVGALTAGSLDAGSFLTVSGPSSPGFIIENTTLPQSWSFSGDNASGLAFYDITNAQTTSYFWPKDGIVGQDGKAQFYYDVAVDGDLSVFQDVVSSGAVSGLTLASTTTISGASLAVTGESMSGSLAVSNQTDISSADVTLTGWDTSTFTYVSGGNAGGSIGITTAGTLSTNPTVKITYKTPVPAAYSFIPAVILTPYQTIAAGTGHWQLIEQTATYFTAAYIGTPVAGYTLGFNYLVFSL